MRYELNSKMSNKMSNDMNDKMSNVLSNEMSNEIGGDMSNDRSNDIGDDTNSKEPAPQGRREKRANPKELLEELKKAVDIKAFREDHLSSFLDTTFIEYLNSIIAGRNLKRSDIIKASGLTETYAYQIFAGNKNPSRDKLIALVIGMRLSLEECQKLLQLAGVNELYPKNFRDAVIIFSINKGLGLFELNDLLYEVNEFTL